MSGGRAGAPGSDGATDERALAPIPAAQRRAEGT